jgi:hypothetical protein
MQVSSASWRWFRATQPLVSSLDKLVQLLKVIWVGEQEAVDATQLCRPPAALCQ